MSKVEGLDQGLDRLILTCPSQNRPHFKHFILSDHPVAFVAECAEVVSFSQLPSGGNASVPRGDEPKLSNSRAASGRAEVRSLKAESGSSSSAVLSQRGAPKYGRPYHRRWEYCPLKRTAQRLASLVVNQRGTISALCRNLEWKKSYRKSFGNLGRKTERVTFRPK